jgi:ATP-dependent Clp protease ATP-binding subunit ClpA
VPEVLLKSTIFALDMGSLLAGTRYPRRLRGAAEGRRERAGAAARLHPVHRRDPHVIGAGATSAARWMRRTC